MPWRMNTQSKMISPRAQASNRIDRPQSGQMSENTRSYEFLGMTFQPLTHEQTVERAMWVTADHGFRYIVTPNVDHVVNAPRAQDDFKPAFSSAWLSVCDSRIIELLAKFVGIPLHAVPGSDLTRSIIENIANSDTPVTMIVGNEKAARITAEKYGLSNIAVHVPPMGLRRNREAIEACAKFMADNPARYHFLCVGSPQQEMIAKAALDRGDCKGLGLCVGASLDFLAGFQSRAPKWMQRSRLEWLYRLCKQPKRLWRRYLVDGPSVFVIYAKWVITSRKAN